MSSVSLFVTTWYVCPSCPTDGITLDIPKAVGTKSATCLVVLLRNLVNAYKYFEKYYYPSIRRKLLR